MLVFLQEFGMCTTCFCNDWLSCLFQFAANVNSKSSTFEKKVHLMQEIASEFSIMWDSKAFEQRMQKPSPLLQVLLLAYHFNCMSSSAPFEIEFLPILICSK